MENLNQTTAAPIGEAVNETQTPHAAPAWLAALYRKFSAYFRTRASEARLRAARARAAAELYLRDYRGRLYLYHEGRPIVPADSFREDAFKVLDEARMGSVLFDCPESVPETAAYTTPRQTMNTQISVHDDECGVPVKVSISIDNLPVTSLGNLDNLLPLIKENIARHLKLAGAGEKIINLFLSGIEERAARSRQSGQNSRPHDPNNDAEVAFP